MTEQAAPAVNPRAWMDEGTALFLSTVDALGNEAFDADTLLPGWTRRHLVAHVHFNAEALRRLTHWAATGEKTAMYASREARDAEIDSGATLPPSRLRELVRGSAAALAADLDALTEEAWARSVVTPQGRTVPATDIVWMRAREIAIHTVDLDAGVSFANLPEELTTALAVDVVRSRAATGHAAALVEWLTGRTATAPTLGPWL
jgi:maleylpyruvate isomerase